MLKKRICAAALSLCLLLGTAVPAWAAEAPEEAAVPEETVTPAAPEGAGEPSPLAETEKSGKCGDNLTWTLDSEGTLTISGTGKMADYTPESESSTAPWSDYTETMVSLVIKEGVTSIGAGAFFDCIRFKGDLTIPDSVTSIGEYAFSNCLSFTGRLTIPDSVTSIGKSAFQNCDGLTGNLTIPKKVTSIGDNAFDKCRFSGKLIIPKSVTSIGENAFGNNEIQTILYAGSAEDWKKITVINSTNNRVLISADKQYNVSVGNCGMNGDNLIWILDSEGTLTISGEGEMKLYTQADNNPWGTNAVSLVIEEGVTSIGRYAFYGNTGFKGSLNIPGTVTSIGNCAFSGASFTGDLTIPDSVTSIGKEAFSFCTGFTGNLSLSKGLSTIAEYAFYKCTNFTGDLTISNGVTTIGQSAFNDCPNFSGKLTIPKSVTSIGTNAFAGNDKIQTILYTGSEQDWNKVDPGKASLPSNATVKCTNEDSDPGPASVTVSGSHAEQNGAGSYKAGTTVTIHAGTLEGYVFNGWTITGVTVDDKDLQNPDLTFTMPANNVTADANWKVAPYRGKLTKDEIKKMLNDAPLTLPEEMFDEEPSVKEPFYVGKLSDSARQAALKRLNLMRTLAGLPEVTLDDTLCESAQYAALAEAYVGDTNKPATQFPDKFAQLPEDIREKAEEAISASGTGLASVWTLTETVDGWINNSSFDDVGNRRVNLSPSLAKVGFGYATNDKTHCRRYTVQRIEYGTPPDYDFVAWPAAGYFPNNMGAFKNDDEKDAIWSVNLCRWKYSEPKGDSVKVTLTGGGNTWTFSKDAKDGYFDVDSDNYYIIFRPSNVAEYKGLYTVKIDGLRDKSGNETSLVYEVEFFNPSGDYTVNVSGSYAGSSGAGRYNAGDTVTLNAGTRAGYPFEGWTITGVTLSEQDLKKTTLSFKMPENDVTAAANWKGAPSNDRLTKKQIQELLRDAPLTLPDELFDEDPSVSEPFRPGKLSASALEAALKRFNLMRALAGLPKVELDESLCENAQYGALAMAYLGTITHDPAKDYPDEFGKLPQDIQNDAAAAASSSNLSAGSTLTGSVDSCMDDSDSNNIGSVGHRRWILSPKMGKVGFGYATKEEIGYKRYTVTKVFDDSGTVPDYDYVAWPAAGYFPNNIDAFNNRTAWSVSLNPEKYKTPDISAVKVTLTCGDKTWTFSQDTSVGDFYVKTERLGTDDCIIFRPASISAYEGLYTVKIEGLQDRGGNETSLTYNVEFFDPDAIPADAPPTAVITSESESDSTTVKVTLPDGSFLPEKTRVFAVNLDGGRLTDTAITSLEKDGQAVFSKSLEPGRKLFFVDPDTLIPLAVPAILKDS